MNISLDTTDVKILDMLQKDGRMTTKALAEQLNLTTTPVFERVKRLEREGVIDKYVALVNQKKIDKNLIVFVSISIKNHTRSYLDNFAKEMNGHHEVQECYHIAGNFDFLLKVILKDMEAYERFIFTKLSVNINIGNVQSAFVLAKNKYSTALAI
ncbi:MAG: Lrp/AsnC family transcriptional regulator [Cyclobacteriaceae bacterium]|nr:Lrp/AsnC family transcriptional regulator [Cyclobacteriaceae bacterium]